MTRELIPFDNPPQKRGVLWRGAGWSFSLILAPALILSLGACGPTVFSGAESLAVVGTLPPPPPPPEPEPEPPAPKLVEVTADKIVIHDKIQFETDKSVIREQSHALLDQIAATIVQNSHIRELSVEGHTDDVGSDKYNLKLSAARAQAVREYLVGKGIAADMLLTQGHGEGQPIQSNENDEGREANRRVEFIITKQDQLKRQIYVDAVTGKEVPAPQK